MIALILGVNFLSGATHAVWGWALGPDAPAPYLFLKVHGLSAAGVQILLGYLIASHIRPAWRSRRNLISGLGVALPLALLVLSGLGLYYVGDESLRGACRVLHTWLGMILPLCMLAHVACRNRSRSPGMPD